MKRTFILVFVCLCLFSQTAFAAGKRVVLTGPFDGGTGSCFIEVGDKQYALGVDSKPAQKIFRSCKFGDKCELVVTLDKDGEIDKVISAKKVK